ncbi:non-specific serine/threonine protein kinase [Ranunculus cassubicifolius]
MTFFLAPNVTYIPDHSLGGCFGLISNCTMSNSSVPVVAIEFDTFPNLWDPAAQGNDHVGIDINSVNSTAVWDYDFSYGGTTYYVLVDYNSSTRNLSVYMNSDERNVFSGSPNLSHAVDLKNILPQWVNVGFSSATGEAFELHTLLSWRFNSTEFPPPPPTPQGKNSTALVVGLTVGIFLLVGGVSLFLFMWRQKKTYRKKDEEYIMSDMSSDDEYENKTGPKRFPYSELVRATNNFTEGGKLGEGGFGGVYRGLLQDSNIEVAVKRISQKSRQGKKEFVSEVKIISQLRHRNLVELLGWCHEREKLLLVYEFMPNGSLDFHLFGGRTMLTWVLRYKIAVGLASGLLYLHEERDPAVVHRDIKSSNIMLDSNFNTKLGDFGLARIADHDMGVKTTMLAGTMGYMAPECMSTGKAGKESDVYSFGVVALEIACGRRVVEPKNELGNFGLVGWAWELYGSGRLLEAVDAKLGRDYDEEQLERLLVVGLWCSNMDHKQRPSIKQAINVLNLEAPLPTLPFKMLVPTHYTPSLQDLGISYTLSSTTSDTRGNGSQVSYNTYSSYSRVHQTSGLLLVYNCNRCQGDKSVYRRCRRRRKKEKIVLFYGKIL